MQQYRRRIFIINKKFQFRFLLYVCSWMFVLSLVYPFMIYNLFTFFLRYVGTDAHSQAASALNATRSNVLWLLALLQALFLGVTLLISVFVSHRIAGPLHKLDRFMKEAAAGNLRSDLKFRTGDHFLELAESYNAMMRQISSFLDTRDQAAAKAAEEVRQAMNYADLTGQRHLRAAIDALQIQPQDDVQSKS